VRCGEIRRYSVTSARASSEGGMVIPSVLAVLRLITNSNLIGCHTRQHGRQPDRHNAPLMCRAAKSLSCADWEKERPPNLAASKVCPGEDPSPDYDLDKHVDGLGCSLFFASLTCLARRDSAGRAGLSWSHSIPELCPPAASRRRAVLREYRPDCEHHGIFTLR
jgi:hypothetical protein